MVSPFPGFWFGLLAGSVKAFRLTKRAPDEWYAPLFRLGSSERFDSVSQVGSPSRR